MADILSKISIIMFIVAAVFFVIAIILFVVFKIPFVIGDLSGKNARRSIEKLRAVNEKTGNKSYRSGPVNIERGKVTAPIKTSGNKQITSRKYNDNETALLKENLKEKLSGTEQTSILMHSEDTQPLSNGDDDTMVLKRVGYTGEEGTKVVKKIQVIEEVILIHTDEVLQL